MEVILAGDLSEKVAEISVDSLDHISIAVPDLTQALDLYRERFGCTVSDPLEVPEQGVRLAYVYLSNAKLELMEPIGHKSPVTEFLKKHPAGGLHHFCLTTQDVTGTAKSVVAAGMRILGGISPKAGHHGRKLFFIHPKDTFGTLIEFEESVAGNN